MQSTPPHTETAPQTDLPAQKKAYHSPNLRAAGSVRTDTEADISGNIPDGMTTGPSMYTFLSPV